MIRPRRGKPRDPEIAPDEIFLDSANAPSFDRAQFEGKIARPLGRAPFVSIALLLSLACLTIIGQSFNLQLLEGEAYAAQSERNSLSSHVVFANRGIITDSKGEIVVKNEASEDGLVERLYKAPGFGAVLGYVSYPKKDSSGNYYEFETTGLAGVEAYFDQVLAGTGGTILVERDALGKVQSQGVITEPMHGSDLVLTLDARAQSALFNSVGRVADSVPFLGGAGVLMEVDTGAVRALVSYPEFDSNVLSSGEPSEVIAGYSTNVRKPYLDRAIAGLYAPGSIVKPLEAVGALEDGVITPEVTVNSTGSISVPNPYDPERPTIFKDWKALGVVDLRAAIAWSSDIYFYMVGGGLDAQKGLGIERLAYWYRLFGLETLTGVELPGESTGFIPTPAWKETVYDDMWRIGDTYHTAIGQYAMQVTPIAIARAFAAIANSGKLVKPMLLEGTPPLFETVAADESAYRIVREGMRRAVTQGTASGLAPIDPWVHIAAKTGTAQTGVRNEYYNSWVVGFFPYEKPKYVFAVVMERGPAGNTIGSVYVAQQFFTKLHEVAPEYFE